MTSEFESDGTSKDIIGSFSHEPLSDGTLHELYLLVGMVAVEFDKTPSWDGYGGEGKDYCYTYFAIFEPRSDLLITVERHVKPFTAFGLATPCTAHVKITDKKDIKWHCYDWEFDDSSKRLTVKLEHASYYPRPFEGGVEEDLILWLFRKRDELSEEEGLRLRLFEETIEERHREKARAEEEGLDKPSEQQARELIGILQKLTAKDLKPKPDKE